MNQKERAILRRICDGYAAKGRHIESGWIEYCAKVRFAGAEEEFNDARAVFFAGSFFMWRKILEMSEGPGEPSSPDFLYQVYEELQQQGFESDMTYPTQGNA